MSPATLDLTTTPLTLPADAKILAVHELSPRLRARIGDGGDGQSVVTRPGFRITARMLPAALTALVCEFRTPSLVTDAVVRFAHAHAQSPEETIDLAFDALAALVEARILVPEGSPDATAPEATLAAGQSWAGVEIAALVRGLEDSELYRGVAADGTPVALKIGREGQAAIASTLAREARVLAALDGDGAPRLLDAGYDRGRPYLVMTWCDGVAVSVAAQQARSAGDRRRLRALAADVAAAYARLHDRGVLHGDVHPGNCLVGDDGRIVVVDFGSASPVEAPALPDPTRAGIPQFHDPQMAAALLAGTLPLAADVLAEQYAVAALVHLLVTGVPPTGVTAERVALLQAIVAQPLPAFASQGVAAWPSLEQVLARALAKAPADRFVSMTAFADAIRAAALPRARRPGRRRAFSRAAMALDGQLASIAEAGADVRTAEHAWLALQAALAFEDPQWLALAEVLLDGAPETWQAHAVAVAIARARSDTRRELRAAEALIALGSADSAVPAPAGALRAAATLVRVAPWHGPACERLRHWMRDAGPVAPAPAAPAWQALAEYQRSGDRQRLSRARRAGARAAPRSPALHVALLEIALQAPEIAAAPPWLAGLAE